MTNKETLPVLEAVADAIRYYRYRGAGLSSIDSYAGIRTDRTSYKNQRDDALSRLETESYAERRGQRWYMHPTAFKLARGDSFAPEFEGMDFSIAFASAGSGDNCDLVKLIRTFDFIVRTVPSFDEMYGGLNRLVAARLLSQKRGCYSPTKQANELFATAKSESKQSMYDQLQAFTRLILCPCCGVNLKRVTWRVPLTEQAYSAALKAYREARR